MNNSRTKNATLNIVFAILLQIVTFIRGLILPRIIIPTYGSDVNGMISSITQFLSYISLLEAGVGSIFRASLYKPLAKRDFDGVSGIINEQKRFYRKLGVIFSLYVVVLCFIYPIIAKTQINKGYIVTCILILSVSTFAEYFVSLPYVSLLSADQRVRITYIVSIIYTIINIFVTLFWVRFEADIRLIYLSMCIIGLLRPLFYVLYVKRHYRLSKNAKCDETALKQRWNGMVHHFAFYIHNNTDSTILTVFISTAMVSVYNVYGAIIFGVEKIITSISTGTAAGIGNLIAIGDKERIDKTIDAYELVQGGTATVMYTIAGLLLIPFVKIYTAKMTDMNYIQPWFGYVLILAEVIYCFRCIYSTVSTNANKFKETQLGAIIECITNLILSLFFVLVLRMGILGVAIGTAMAMFARYVFDVSFLSENVIFRPKRKAFKMLFVSTAISVISIFLCNILFDYNTADTFLRWIISAIFTSVVTGAVAATGYSIFYKDTVKGLIFKILKRG